MKVQHVQALAADDPFPPTTGLPEGYAIIKDGKTWCVRGAGWLPGNTGGSGSGSPVPPDPGDPAAPATPVGVPSEVELERYANAFGTLSLSDTSAYVPDAAPVNASFHMDTNPGGVPAMVTLLESGQLLMRRPGYYRVSLELIQGDVPTGQRGHVQFMPINGVSMMLAINHGQHATYDGGVTYFANPDDDPDFGNEGGLVAATLLMEIPASGAAPTPPLAVRYRVTPVIFTGPEVPVTPLVQFSNIVVAMAGTGHISVTVDVTGANTVQAMVTKVDGDPEFVGDWEDMTDSGGTYHVTLDVPAEFDPTNWAAYISISGTSDLYVNGTSYRYHEDVPG